MQDLSIDNLFIYHHTVSLFKHTFFLTLVVLDLSSILIKSAFSCDFLKTVIMNMSIYYLFM